MAAWIHRASLLCTTGRNLSRGQDMAENGQCVDYPLPAWHCVEDCRPPSSPLISLVKRPGAFRARPTGVRGLNNGQPSYLAFCLVAEARRRRAKAER
jgi:hypothetical protein